MLLPGTNAAVFLLLICSTLCLGSWANAQRLAGKWRFELFYYDYAIGAAVCALAAALTLGSMDSRELTFQDNLLIASRRAMACMFGAGMVFSLANMLLLGAMQVSGMAVAFPIALGLASIAGAIWSYFLNPAPNAMLMFSSASLTLIAILAVAVAHARRSQAVPGPPPGMAGRRGVRPPSAALGITLGLISGILLSLYRPLSDAARQGEIGVGPYGAALLFSGGILLSTILCTPFFVNFPVQGEPIPLRAYFKGAAKQHLWGIWGGMLWMAGTLAAFTAAGAGAAAQPNPAVSYGLGQAVALVSALWGLLVWREFRAATQGARSLLTVALLLYAGGIVAAAAARFYSK